MVTCGVDHIEEYLQYLAGGRVGLLTSVTGRDRKNRTTISVLQKLCHLTALFAPEHGVRGNIGAGVEVETEIDAGSGLPVYSLYSTADKRFTEEMLNEFDILVYDIQDIGVRFYTFLSTLHHALKDCGKAGKRLVVLDRPNPLSGEVVEGGILDMEYSSFVGCYPFPIRYGLTSGEAANMMNEEMNLGCDVVVVPCRGWKRNSLFSDWGTVFMPPSMGLMTFESVLLYPGTCLIEGTNLSEGRGTGAPFRIIGAPFIDGEELTNDFQSIGLEGVAATPVWFTPTTSKFQGEQCGGILLHVTNGKVLRPVTMGITLLDILRKKYPKDYKVLAPYREGGRPFLSLLTGNGEFLADWDKDEVLERYQRESQEFGERKKKFHLYE